MPHPYNPVAPEDSYTRLITDVEAALLAMCDQLGRAIVNQQQEVQSTAQSSLLAALPCEEREALGTRAVQLGEAFKALGAELVSARENLAVTAVIEDFPATGEGRFTRLLQQLGRVKGDVAELHPKVEDLSRALQALALTGPEEQLLGALPSDAQAIEASELRQSAPGLSENEFWAAVGGLHAKRRLRIVVEAVRRG